MAVTNINIRVDRDVKEEAEAIFSLLGLNMTTAVNMFLRAVIREDGIPFPLYLVPNAETIAAIEEGDRLVKDPNAKRYSSMEELLASLNGDE